MAAYDDYTLINITFPTPPQCRDIVHDIGDSLHKTGTRVIPLPCCYWPEGHFIDRSHISGELSEMELISSIKSICVTHLVSFVILIL